jgi:DNA-binding response OmpR family regulator
MYELQNCRLLMLSDDADVAESWGHGLRQRGFYVDVHELTAATIHGLQAMMPSYSLAIIDVNESETEETFYCGLVRAHFLNPLLLFTYETDERVHLRIYNAGTDECVAKPIGIGLLLSKIRAWLHRSMVVGALNQPLERHAFKVDNVQRRITTPAGITVRLSRFEFRLFQLLMTNHNQILEAELIIDRVWEADGGDISQLKNLVYRLRQKIEPNPSQPRYIHTEPYHGYVLRS